MTRLNEILTVSINEGAVIDFESSLDKDIVVSGYVPVKSTLEVFKFLKQAAEPQSPQGRAIVCHGSYGVGKSRLCAVVARLFRDGFDCAALEPVWDRLIAREEQETLSDLRQTLQPGGGAWRPWLVVPVYAQGGGGTLSASLIRALVKALRRAGLGEEVLGRTIYSAAAQQLEKMIQRGEQYTPVDGSRNATPEQLKRALEEDLDETALEEFRQFFKKVTHFDFGAALLASDEVAAEAYGVYNAVAEHIQTCGYAGIIVIWDEFGFAIEEMLRDAQRNVRSLGQETMKLQEFVERACGNKDQGKRVVFLGFAHVSIPEYGTRQRLNETDQDRLVTVSGRFRTPSITIRLSVTETEGYHLLAGLLQRTDLGRQVFDNPVPRLQRLADRMPEYQAWQRYSKLSCYRDIAAPCYPMHPATATALILLSDQIAQINRTTFYYLQDDGPGGLTGILRTREISNLAELGGRELARVSDLFYYFEGAIRIEKRQLYDEYQEAVARFPAASDMDKALLRTVLVLSVVADASLTPTTAFLCFCEADAMREELEAQPVHEALRRLVDAGALWKNEATDVWRFVGGPGVGAKIDCEVESELELVPPDREPARLLRDKPGLRVEIADRLGNFDLDPCDAGTVRRIGVQILDASKDEREIEAVNPARNGSGELWRSALVYLVLADTSADLITWRQRVAAQNQSSLYFVFPPKERPLDRSKIRELIAVKNILGQKDPASHAYEVLDGRYTKLRRDLRQEFDQAFGNLGLRSGTTVVRAGQGDAVLPVESWNQLLPAILADLDKQFCNQVRVRCGSFNQWQEGGNWSKIENIVKGILKFEPCDQYWNLCPGKIETSQEAAIIDGVLVENRLLKQDVPGGAWTLAEVDGNFPLEALREVWKHFSTAGDRDFSRLHSRLVEPPYGIPNAVIPILVALVLRTEESRIGIYESWGSQPRRIETESRIIDAIIDMAKHPPHYLTRYTKLTGPQRVVFRAIGPITGLTLLNRQMVGEAFLEYCCQVRTKLVDWVKLLPEAILKATEFTEPERGMLKLAKGAISPQLPNLADALVEVVRQDTSASEELAAADAAVRSFPAIEAKWQELRERIERYVEGIKATVRARIRDITPNTGNDAVNPKAAFAQILRSFGSDNENDNQPLFQVIEKLEAADNADVADSVASAITGVPTAKLTEGDYARVGGYIEAFSLVQKQRDEQQAAGVFLVTLPSGEVRRLPVQEESQAGERVTAEVTAWRNDLAISVDQLAFIALRTLFSETAMPTPISADNQGAAEASLLPSASDDFAVTPPQP